MDSKMSLRITSFCLYNGIMVYLYISMPHYTLKELKADIITSWCNHSQRWSYQFLRKFVWEKRNKSDSILDEFPGAIDFKEINSWRVEYDENIHPVAINKNYRSDIKDHDIVTNSLR